MVMDRELVLILNVLHYFIDAWIGKFFHFAALLTNEVFMMAVVEGFFELGDVVTKLMFDHQFAIQEQVDGVVKCRTADPIVFVFHENIERLYIKVPRMGIYFIEDGKSFRCFPMSFFL